MIYLHTPPPSIGTEDEDDQYFNFNSENYPTCSGTCGYCPLVHLSECVTAAVELLNLYPTPTILTLDTHPEIFL
jgi:hypothetical protein